MNNQTYFKLSILSLFVVIIGGIVIHSDIFGDQTLLGTVIASLGIIGTIICVILGKEKCK